MQVQGRIQSICFLIKCQPVPVISVNMHATIPGSDSTKPGLLLNFNFTWVESFTGTHPQFPPS